MKVSSRNKPQDKRAKVYDSDDCASEDESDTKSARKVLPRPTAPPKWPDIDPKDHSFTFCKEITDRMRSRLKFKSGDSLLQELEKIAWQKDFTQAHIDNPEIPLRAFVKSLTFGRDIRKRWPEYPDTVETLAKRLIQRWDDGIYVRDPLRRWDCVGWREPTRGAMGLLVGEVFIMRRPICELGFHGAYQSGIAGKKGEGAHSIVVSGSSYMDRDSGDSLWYSGTINKEDSEEMTRSTALLDETLRLGPSYKARVFRTARCDAVCRPAAGVRYDGLYNITDKRPIAGRPGNFCYLFERCKGQPELQLTPSKLEAGIIERSRAEAKKARKGR